jgi:hypothetical protein
MISNETLEHKAVRVEDPALRECRLFGAKRPNAQMRPSASDDSFDSVLANIADLRRVRFNAVEARLPHERQVVVWRHLRPS